MTPVYGTYIVKAIHLNYFLAGLEKVNKKGAQIGVPVLRLGDKRKIVDEHGEISYEINVLGQPVQIEGYSFLATLEHHNGLNIIRGIPGMPVEDLKAYVTAENTNCDFCHSKRDRLQTYVIKGEDGTLKQVGGQCLKKFMGDAAKKLLKFSFGAVPLLETYVDPRERSSTGHAGYDALTVLTCAAALVRAFGFRKSDQASSTSGWIRHCLYGMNSPYYDGNDNRRPEDYTRVAMHPTEDDEQLARDAVAWLKTQNTMPTTLNSSSFLFSVGTIIDVDMVTWKDTATIAALIPVYQRHLAHKDAISKTAARPSNWIGNPGDKLPMTPVTVVYTKPVNGTFGTSQMVKMEDDNGNSFTWFNTGTTDLEMDAKYNIVGRVKKHDEFNGRKTTVLIRVNATKVEDGN